MHDTASEREHIERLLAEAKASLTSPPQLPKWSDDDGMKVWLHTMLDRMDAVRWFEVCAVPDHVISERVQRRAFDEAERGNIKPLRDAYPDLAPFLHPPKRKRGQRFPKDRPNRLMAAVADVSRIRNLWRRHFGRVKRRRDQLSAEDIAAALNEVDVNKLHAALAHRARLWK